MSKKERKKKEKQANPDVKGQDKPQPQRPRIVERPTIEMLPCTLTAELIGKLALESAHLHGDVANLEQEKKNSTASYSARIKGLNARIAEINRKIETGKEERQVKCIMRFDYHANTKTLIRTDTDDEIATYTLSPEERQMLLPLSETKNDKVAKSADTVPQDKQAAPVDADQIETKIRIWFNGQGREERKKSLMIDSETAALSALLSFPYAKLSDVDKDIVRAAYGALSKREEAPAEAGKDGSEPDK
jgi:hypothetical protein